MDFGQSWEDRDKWSDAKPASPRRDYLNNSKGRLTRTPTGTATFAGDSLTITNGAQLQIQASSGQTITINNLTVSTGSHVRRGTAGTATLAGNIALAGKGGVVFDAQGTNRITNIAALLTAAPTVDTIVVDVLQTKPETAVNTTGFVFTNAGNTFAGTWDVQAGLLKGTGLGTSSFRVASLGFLDFDADYVNQTGNLTIEEGGKLLLDQNLTFGTVSILDTVLTPGVYTGDDLISSFGSAFAEGSLRHMTLTVISGPSS